MSNLRNKNLHIESLRGLACLLLVVYHTIGDTPLSGLNIEEGFYRHISDQLSLIRMPLFALIAGYIYANRRYNGNNKYFTSKAHRILVPFLFIGSLFSLVRHFYQHKSIDLPFQIILNFLVSPDNHFWFLQAIFIVFIVIAILEVITKNSNKRIIPALIAISLIAYLSPYQLGLFSLNGATYLLPFFTLGFILNTLKIKPFHSQKYQLATYVMIVFALIIIIFSYSFESGRSIDKLLISILLISLLYLTNMKSNALTLIGSYSYFIFLYHVFFTASTRTILNAALIDSLEVQVIIITSMGVLGPMLLQILFTKCLSVYKKHQTRTISSPG